MYKSSSLRNKVIVNLAPDFYVYLRSPNLDVTVQAIKSLPLLEMKINLSASISRTAKKGELRIQSTAQYGFSGIERPISHLLAITVNIYIYIYITERLCTLEY